MTVAQRLSSARSIARKGQRIALASTKKGAYNPAAGAPAPAGPSTAEGHAVIFAIPKGSRKLEGISVTGSAYEATLSALDVTDAPLPRPSVNDTLTDAQGLAYVVIAAESLAPAGLEIIHTLILEAGQ